MLGREGKLVPAKPEDIEVAIQHEARRIAADRGLTYLAHFVEYPDDGPPILRVVTHEDELGASIEVRG